MTCVLVYLLSTTHVAVASWRLSPCRQLSNNTVRSLGFTAWVNKMGIVIHPIVAKIF